MANNKTLFSNLIKPFTSLAGSKKSPITPQPATPTGGFTPPTRPTPLKPMPSGSVSLAPELQTLKEPITPSAITPSATPPTANFQAQLENMRKQATGIQGQLTGMAPTTPTAAPTGETPTTPTAPTITPEVAKAMTDAEKNVAELSKISAGEFSTQEDIDRLIESAQKGIFESGQQAVPLEFITGQQKAIEQRALGLIEPLDRKLARLEAQRTGSLESSKFALERADVKAERERETASDISEKKRQERLEAEDIRRFEEEQEFAEQKFEEEKRQFGIDAALKARGVAIDEATAAREAETAESSESVGKGVDKLNFLEATANKALELAHASGRSGLRKTAEGALIGSTDFTNLESFTNTLRTNVLVLANDPSIKKFFGPQMSEADVKLMTAAGTTLNPVDQDPDVLRDEITRLLDMFNRMKASLEIQTPAEQNPAMAPVGSEFEIGGTKYRKVGENQFEEI